MSESKEVKTRLFEQLDTLAEPNGKVLKFKRGDNQGPILGRIYFWQETQKRAKSELEAAWKAAKDEGVVDSDEKLREAQGEEKILIESDQFTLMAKVDKPRSTFSRDKFIESVAKKYKIDPAKLNAIAAACTTDGLAPLSKRVIEV